MSGAVKLGIVVAAVIALCLLAWGDGELHYRGCIASAEARYPLGGAEPGPNPRPGSYLAERNEAAAGCSRWP